jgi:hypothetical protein
MTSRTRASKDKEENTEPTSSQGDNSKSVTPKDVPSRTAASDDVKARKTTSEDVDEKQEEMLDDAVEMTFPASDPIAIPSPDKLDRQKRKGA